MSEIELLGGGLWQWDTSRRMHVEVPGATEVHFATVDSERAMVIPLGVGVVQIPDILLTVGSGLAVWATDGRDTLMRAVFRVRRRAKPEGYFYTEQEVKTWADVESWVREQLKAAGEPGTKWYVGEGGPALGGRVGDLYLDSETGIYYRYEEKERLDG